MENNQFNSLNNGDSIFSNLTEQQNTVQSGFKDVQIQENSSISNLLDSISNKFNEFKSLKLQKEAQKVFEKNGPFMRLLGEFGCTIELCSDCIKVNCDALNKKGKITVNKNKTIELDDDAKYIFEYVANAVNRTGSLNDIITKYEEQGFYPVGELTKETAIINGEECEVLVGTLENENKEQKTIYYYNGQELFLGEQ